jgi:hypothetical protein
MGNIELTDFFSMPEDHTLYKPIRQKLIIAGKTPDKDSNFDKNTLEYRNLPNEQFLAKLKEKGYDVLILYEDLSDEKAHLHGYIAYQIKEEKAGIFERIVHEEVEGNTDLTRKLIEGTLEHLKNKGVKKINFDSNSEELIDFLKKKEEHYDILVNVENRSVYFLPIQNGRY